MYIYFYALAFPRTPKFYLQLLFCTQKSYKIVISIYDHFYMIFATYDLYKIVTDMQDSNLFFGRLEILWLTLPPTLIFITKATTTFFLHILHDSRQIVNILARRNGGKTEVTLYRRRKIVIL